MRRNRVDLHAGFLRQWGMAKNNRPNMIYDFHVLLDAALEGDEAGVSKALAAGRNVEGR